MFLSGPQSPEGERTQLLVHCTLSHIPYNDLLTRPCDFNCTLLAGYSGSRDGHEMASGTSYASNTGSYSFKSRVLCPGMQKLTVEGENRLLLTSPGTGAVQVSKFLWYLSFVSRAREATEQKASCLNRKLGKPSL